MVKKQFLSYWASSIHGGSQFLHLLPIVYLLTGVSQMEMSEVLGNAESFSTEKGQGILWASFLKNK